MEQRVDEIAFNMMIIIFLTSAISLTACGPFNYHRPSPFFGRPSYPVPVYFNKYFTIPYTSHPRIERKNQKYKEISFIHKTDQESNIIKDTITSHELGPSSVSPVKAAMVNYVNSLEAKDPCKTELTEGSTTTTKITNQAPSDSALFTQGFNSEAVQDPICSAASLAYLDARMSGKMEEEAFAAATKAFIEALEDSDKEPSNACAQLADAFIDAL